HDPAARRGRVPERRGGGCHRLAADIVARLRVNRGFLMSATDRIEQIKDEASQAIAGASTTAELEQIRVRFLGRKADLTGILRGIAELPADERGAVGKAGNETRVGLDQMLQKRSAELDASEITSRLAEDAVDITLPGSPPAPAGSRNLLLRT